MKTLGELRDEGKVRFVGVSNFGVGRLEEALEVFPDIVVNELPYSLLSRAIEFEALPGCVESGVGVIGYMTLLQGLLADIYPTLELVPPWQRRTRHFNSGACDLSRHGESGAEQETGEALSAIRECMADCGLSMPALAIKWAVANPAITCALVGARSIAELEDNIEFVRRPIPRDIYEKLDVATRPLMEKMGLGFDYYESIENDRTV
ncbi:MAG: aldo/keto reductase [Victivallales bacterium]|nr:aldo/keto reductase [Victivallales bacterium]